MKDLHVSEDILPIGKFKVQAARFLSRLKETSRPLVLTQNGKPAAVLITPRDFDRYRERERFLAAVEEGLADSGADRVIEDEK